jgi:hypothetical protein
MEHRRKKPGPGQYDVTKYSDFHSKASKEDKDLNIYQNYFGTSRKELLPPHLRSKGIGDSLSDRVGPASYMPDNFLEEKR